MSDAAAPQSFPGNRGVRSLVVAVLVATLSVATVSMIGRPKTPPPDHPPTQAVTPPAGTGSSKGSDLWKEVERLVSEQKYEAAAKIVARLREDARSNGNDAEWARALIEDVQLRTALHGYETAVRFLKDESWPQSTIPHATLELFYARTLVTYVQAYGWEVGQRERVDSKGPVDLKAWSRDQIVAESTGAFARVWSVREELGREPVGRLSHYLLPNNYPERIRGTLRDAISYLFVELLADSSLWRPEEENDLYRLDLPALIERNAPPRAQASANGSPHPLVTAAMVLSDLETWHRGRGEQEAAYEARLVRLRMLHAAFSGEADRRTILHALETSLPSMRRFEWWGMGQALLAEMIKAEGKPDSLERARAVASEGERVFPASLGAQTCAAVAREIEAPSYRLEAASADGLRRRSIEVMHKNVAALYFRAFAVDLVHAIETGKDYNMLPAWREVQEIFSKRRPDAEWTIDLPATPDFREHRTFVTPPLGKPGLWVVVASARKDFIEQGNRLAAVDLVLGDIALVLRSNEGGVEATVLSGRTGKPIEGAEVSLVRFDWQKGHHVTVATTSDARGLVRLPYDPSRAGAPYALIARKGADIGADLQGFSFAPESRRSTTTGSLVYTDRSIYRPLQKISWKVVAYRGGGESASFKTEPGTSVTMTLMDANNQKVDSKTMATNGFGSAAGEFIVPAGRLLGAWRLVSSLGGGAAVRIEEYKRPTFEVAMKDPESPLRLNRQAKFAGEVRYYFGLPVVNGEARWRVTRQPVYPWWWWGCWGCWGWRGPAASQAQIVASGRGPLREDGTFEIRFTPEVDERETTKDISYQYALAVDVTDEGGETRSAGRSFRLGFVSVEANIQAETTFFRAGEQPELTVHRTNLDGTAKPGEGSWVLTPLVAPTETLLPAEQPFERPPSDAPTLGYQTAGDQQRERWNPSYDADAILRSWPDGEVADRGAVTHDGHGEALVRLRSLAPGAYRLRYETKDDYGATCRAQKEFVVTDARHVALPLPFLFLVERGSVAVGDSARLFVHSALAGQPLILELWREGRRTERRELTAGVDPELIEIPIGEGDRGGFSVTLTALRDHQLMTSTQAVLVPWDDKELKVEFATFRDRLRPGAKETWRVSVKAPKEGRLDQGAAEILAYMYDKSLDLFAPHNPAAVTALYPTRAGAGWLRGNMQLAGESWESDGCYSCTAPAPVLQGDRLRFYAGYPVGGMGRQELEQLAYLKSGVAGGVPGGIAGGVPALQAEVPADEVESKDLRLDKSKAAPPSPQPPPPPPPGETALRSNFSETAFFAPHLLVDAEGRASIEFTVPDSVTAWNVWVHAVTRDLRGGSVHKETRSVKDLMVRPYLPRFLREGDAATLAVTVNNAGTQPMTGRVELDIVDPETNASLASAFGLSAASRPFSVKPDGGTTVTFDVKAPSHLGTVAFRVAARSGDESDGELRPVPILPGRMRLAQSRFVALKDVSRRELAFADLAKDDDPTRQQEQLVVTLDTQLFYSVLASLPYLVNYPYECTEQTLNRFLSTGIVSSLYEKYPSVGRMARELSKRETRLETWDAADPNRRMGLEETPWLEEAKGGADPGAPLLNVLDPRIAAADREASLAKLTKAQTSLGGFPWWAGGPPSPYMTLYILNGFSRALEFGVPVPKDVIVRAWAYMHRHYLDTFVHEAMERDCCFEEITFLGYVLSSYPDASFTGGVFTDSERREMLEFSFRHWREHSPLLKGYLALTLKRMGREGDAKLVFDSVMDSAKTTDDLGTFWAAEDRSWLWYNDTIETHAFSLRVLMELDPTDPRRDGLVQWLFLNKKLNHWKSTRATAEVVYSLVHYLQHEGQLGAREEVAVTLGGDRHDFVFEPDRYTGKKTQVTLPGTKIEPGRDSTIVVEKRTKGIAFASATWMFSTEHLPEQDRGDFFEVSRQLFRRDQRGGEWVLTPLAEGARIAVGDEVEMQVSLRTKHEAEYVHLRDPRAAGFEPVSAVSRQKYDLGISWYEETRDSGTNFFFEKLPVGEYTFHYRLRAATAGAFKVSPATVQSMYAPEFNAYTAGTTIAIGTAR